MHGIISHNSIMLFANVFVASHLTNSKVGSLDPAAPLGLKISVCIHQKITHSWKRFLLYLKLSVYKHCLSPEWFA